MNLRLAFVVTLLAWGSSACSHRMASADPSGAIAAADRDGDGRVTHAEFLKARQARFDQLDRTSDGFISGDDFGRLAKRRADRQGGLQQAVQESDADRDGRVSRPEFDRQSESLFRRLDADGNGWLSAQEIEAGARARASASR